MTLCFYFKRWNNVAIDVIEQMPQNPAAEQAAVDSGGVVEKEPTFLRYVLGADDCVPA